MRFSAAIDPIAPCAPAPQPLPKLPIERQPPLPPQSAARTAHEPPADLDQRVRLSGEW